MKKIIVIGIGLLLACNLSFAKKVKFAVDMTGTTVSSNGVYVTGDFQVAAGYTSDWDNTATRLTQEGSTNIYSIVVDITANTKYEYKFINGNLWYDVEFVPVASRVSEDNDSRWLYVGDQDNDTLAIGAILYSGNAPTGKYLARVLVDLQKQTVNANGVFASAIKSGSGDAFLGTNTSQLYALNNKIYEGFLYLEAGNYEYKFFNGNTSSDSETVPTACASNDSRSLVVSVDAVLDTVCFSECGSCGTTSAVKNTTSTSQIKLYPNVIEETATLSINAESAPYSIVIKDINGRTYKSYSIVSDGNVYLKKGNLSTGNYFILIKDKNNKLLSTEKFIIK